MDAAQLVLHVYDTAFDEELSVDDGGGHDLVSEACRSALGQILARASEQEERKIFYLLHGFLEESDWDWGSDDLEELILSLDWSPELQQKNLQWLDDNLDSGRMEQRRDSESAYHPLLQLYEEHDLPKAIALVREKRGRANHGEYTKPLLRLLERAGKQDGYETELRHLVLKLKCHETEYLSRLKEITPQEQWQTVFKTLLADAKYPSGRMELYHFEGMLTELFEELCQNPSFSSFTSYEAELRDWNPQRTLTYYVEILKREMDTATQRKDYRHIIRHLEKMKDYPDGANAARNLADYWYGYHKNRPAMKDELLKAGYPQK